MDYERELELWGETTLVFRDDSERYVIRDGRAIPARWNGPVEE